MLRSISVGKNGYRSLHNGLQPTIKSLMRNPPAVNTNIQASGHIKSIRNAKNVTFLDVSDGSDHRALNIVLQEPEKLQSMHFKMGQSIMVKGEWIKSKGNQDYELTYNPSDSSHDIKIIGDVEEIYPIQKKHNSLTYLRNFPTLRHRTSTLASVLRLRSFIEWKLFEFFNENDFTKVTPPIITSSDCEGAGEQFKIDKVVDNDPNFKFFGKDTNLTVSTQLHLEALTLSLNRAWTLSPCFRAEDSNTNRHLSEFWMLEAEICYLDNLKQLTDFTESMIRYVTEKLSSDSLDVLQSRYNKQDIALIQQRWQSILSNNPWPKITYTEALEIINKTMLKGRSKGRLTWGDSIQTVHEKWLAGTHFQSPVFITDYPTAVKPFYMPKSTPYDNEKPTVACFDLILPEIGELVGGSLREYQYDELLNEMKSRNMNIQDMEWYISTRRNGSVPHGGFGMGFDRLVAYLSGIENLKDVIPFPRVPEDCKC